MSCFSDEIEEQFISFVLDPVAPAARHSLSKGFAVSLCCQLPAGSGEKAVSTRSAKFDVLYRLSLRENGKVCSLPAADGEGVINAYLKN